MIVTRTTIKTSYGDSSIYDILLGGFPVKPVFMVPRHCFFLSPIHFIELKENTKYIQRLSGGTETFYLYFARSLFKFDPLTPDRLWRERLLSYKNFEISWKGKYEITLKGERFYIAPNYYFSKENHWLSL